MPRISILSYLRALTVEPLMFLYMLASFMQYPTFQALVYNKVCLEAYNASLCENLDNDTFSQEDTYVQKQTSQWIQYNNIALAVPSFVVVLLFLGPVGDSVGRKLTLVLPIIGCILYTINNLVCVVTSSCSVSYLLVGSVLNGLFGGFVACMMSMYSYVGHISSQEFRTIRISVLESMIYLAGGVGALISGVMLDGTSFLFVFSFILGTLLSALIYVLLFVKNIKPEQSVYSRLSLKQKTLLTFKEPWLCVTKHREGRIVLHLLLLIFSIFILMMMTAGENDVLLLFTRLPKLDWSQSIYGYYKGAENFLRGLGVLILLPLILRKFRLRDTTLIYLGLVSKITSLLVIGFSMKTWMVFLGGVLGVLQGFPSAGIRSLMSGMVNTNEQGKMFGLVASAESMAMLIATVLFNNLYSATLDILDGFCFLFAAGLGLLIGIVVICVHCTYVRVDEEPYTTLTEEESYEGNPNSGDGI